MIMTVNVPELPNGYLSFIFHPWQNVKKITLKKQNKKKNKASCPSWLIKGPWSRCGDDPGTSPGALSNHRSRPTCHESGSSFHRPLSWSFGGYGAAPMATSLIPWFLLLGFLGPLSSRWFESSGRQKFAAFAEVRFLQIPPLTLWLVQTLRSRGSRRRSRGKPRRDLRDVILENSYVRVQKEEITGFFNSLSVVTHCPGRAVSLLVLIEWG